MTVTRETLEALIADIANATPDARGGIYGPGSKAWEVARESVVFLGGGRAALLQLAHPFVAHAVDQHSQTRTDPTGRFRRTFLHVYAIVFGDLDHAFKSARGVHAIHTRIEGTIREDVGRYAKGDRYEANHEGALFWVHATLIDSAVQAFELCVRRLEAWEKERHYQETKRFARLFGVPDAAMPADWPAFRAYMERMVLSDEVVVGDAAREIAGFLLAPPRPALAPVTHWYRAMTAGLLPARVREGYGFAYGVPERLAFRASIRAIRATRARLPARLRYVPAYLEAERRIAGAGPDRVGAWLEKAALRAMGAAARG